MPPDNSGRVLKKDDVHLYKISREAGFDMPTFKRFAARLLNGSGCALNADAFLNSLDPHVATTIPAKMSDLLKYW